MELLEQLLPVLEEKKPRILAIDGRCGSGKTTLAEALRQVLPCQVVHMDEFFLRPHQRTEARLAIPGENVDHERFLQEVLLPLKAGKSFAYRPYNCSSQGLQAPVALQPGMLTIVEGSYCCHPALWDFYDLRIFLTVGREEQLRRIEKRSGAEKLKQFKTRWIPLEEAYFSRFDLKNRCDLVFSTGESLRHCLRI